LKGGGLIRKFRNTNSLLPVRPRHGSWGQVNIDNALASFIPGKLDHFNGVQSEGENIDVRAPAELFMGNSHMKTPIKDGNTLVPNSSVK
jgi:hypothetical protein